MLRLIELQPRVSESFPDGLKSHAERVVALLDSILQLLGPDHEFMEEVLHRIGERHKKMGVSSGPSGRLVSGSKVSYVILYQDHFLILYALHLWKWYYNQVDPSFFPYMGDSLMHALESGLDDDFDTESREAWREVYDAIADDLVKAMSLVDWAVGPLLWEDKEGRVQQSS